MLEMSFMREVRVLGLMISLPLVGITCAGQSTCKHPAVLNPLLCEKVVQSNQNLGHACQQEILQNYLDQLLSAFHVFHIPLVGQPLSNNPQMDHTSNHKEKMDGYSNSDINLQPLTDNLTSNLVTEIVTDRLALNDRAQPLPIEGKEIYLNDNQLGDFGVFARDEGCKIAELGRSVGRLEISTANEKGTNYFQWGTGFAIADDVLVTTCHEIEPLIQPKNDGWVFTLEKGESLYIDFGERDDRFRDTKKYKIKDVLAVPDEEGLDIALLSVEKIPGKKAELGPMPAPPTGTKGREVVVLGYPDFHHFIDPRAEEAFDSYKFQGTAKFVSLGCAMSPQALDACKNEPASPFLTHTATTTMGESGGILIDRSTQAVIGIHSCCSYPQKGNGSAPQSKLNCAHLKQLSPDQILNQAISVCAIFKNQKLKEMLKAHNIEKPPGC